MTEAKTSEIWDAAMQRAVELACESHAPFGAVICRFDEPGRILFEGRNATNHDPTGHAEVNAIRSMSADSKHDPADLVVVTTAEPCPMCAAACWWAGIGLIVFGTSIRGLIDGGWRQIDHSADGILARATSGPIPAVTGPYRPEWTDPLYRRSD